MSSPHPRPTLGQILLGLVAGFFGLVVGAIMLQILFTPQEGKDIFVILVCLAITLVCYLAVVAGFRLVTGFANGPEGPLPTWGIRFFGFFLLALMAAVLVSGPNDLEKVDLLAGGLPLALGCAGIGYFGGEGDEGL